MTTPAEALARYLAAQGVGAFGGNARWAISFSREAIAPPAHADVITLYDTPGGPADTDAMNVFNPSLQVRTRSKVSSEGYAKHIEIRNLLTKTAPIETGGHYFVGIELVSDIGEIGRDEKDRHLLTANYQLQTDEAEGEGEGS